MQTLLNVKDSNVEVLSIDMNRFEKFDWNEQQIQRSCPKKCHYGWRTQSTIHLLNCCRCCWAHKSCSEAHKNGLTDLGDLNRSTIDNEFNKFYFFLIGEARTVESTILYCASHYFLVRGGLQKHCDKVAFFSKMQCRRRKSCTKPDKTTLTL